ncbi:MAG: AAA family ATPase, partial [Promethearchaeota archaeon]
MREYHSLQQFTVFDLFGKYTHTIDFSQSDDLIILYGVNGTGKTHLLKILYFFFSHRWDELFTMDFSKLELTFNHQDDQSKQIRIEIAKKPEYKVSIDSDDFKYSRSVITFPDTRMIMKDFKELKTMAEIYEKSYLRIGAGKSGLNFEDFDIENISDEQESQIYSYLCEDIPMTNLEKLRASYFLLHS